MSLVAWFADGSHWTGSDGVPARLFEHVALSAAVVGIACALALPVGVLLGHLGRGGAVAVQVGNVGRAIPTFGVLLLLATGPLGIGTAPALVALTLFAVPPLLTNAYAGLRGVDRDVTEAARGMGLSGRQLLLEVELPLALPLLLVGIRTAAVQVVATATLAAVVAGGGLGRLIVDGLGRQDTDMVLAGAVLVAALALLTDLALGAVARRVGRHTVVRA